MKIKAISFDCYGTLIDWESGIAAELSAWTRLRALSLGAPACMRRFAGRDHV